MWTEDDLDQQMGEERGIGRRLPGLAQARFRAEARQIHGDGGETAGDALLQRIPLAARRDRTHRRQKRHARTGIETTESGANSASFSIPVNRFVRCASSVCSKDRSNRQTRQMWRAAVALQLTRYPHMKARGAQQYSSREGCQPLVRDDERPGALQRASALGSRRWAFAQARMSAGPKKDNQGGLEAAMTILKSLIAIGAIALIAGCGQQEPGRTSGGAAAGAATGAGIGALAGPPGILAGAVIGGGAGALSGAATNPNQLNLGSPPWTNPNTRVPTPNGPVAPAGASAPTESPPSPSSIQGQAY